MKLSKQASIDSEYQPKERKQGVKSLASSAKKNSPRDETRRISTTKSGRLVYLADSELGGDRNSSSNNQRDHSDGEDYPSDA